jgi:hypothetical protein
MTVTELIQHANRLAADLTHKRREIREHNYSTYTEATLVRQCEALEARVAEILRQCDVLTVSAEDPALLV